MKTVFQSAAKRPKIALAMTPMIDVVFLLLIFFVCTASFQPPEEVLPSDVVVSGAGSLNAPVEPTPELDEVILRGKPVGEQLIWSINDSPCPTFDRLRELLTDLAEIDPTLPVIVDPSGDVPLAEVIRVYDASRRAGFLAVRFAASAE